MQLVTLNILNRPEIGVVVGSDILIVSACARLVEEARLIPTTMKLLLGSPEGLNLLRKMIDKVGGSDALKDDLRNAHAFVPYEKAALLPPITDPGLVLSCGTNYQSHIDEMNAPPPAEPVSFVKNVAALNGSGSPIILPDDYPNMVDFEGEFCAVFGRPCHKINKADALQYVVGYTLLNDVSARDWLIPQVLPDGRAVTQEQAVFRNVLGKQYPTFAPLGPTIVTSDEVPNPNDLQMETRLNGKVMQSTNTSDMIFDVETLIAFFSQFYKFLPGDIITTGTPAGVGFGRTPKVFMRAGDLIEISVGQIGTLANPIIASSAEKPAIHKWEPWV